MDKWISISVDSLKDRKLAALVETMQQAALADDQSDPTPELIQSCVDDLRATIASNSANRLEADETKIPRALKNLICRMIIRAMKDRLEQELTKSEETAWANDEETLKRIESGKKTVDSPDTPVTAQVEQRASVQVVSSNRRQFTRGSMDGL